MKTPNSDAVVIYDRSGRRQFFRTGTAFLLASGTIAHSSGVLAGDCDRPPSEKNANQPGEGSDSDQGANADAAGCGRQEKPKISQMRQPDAPVPPVKVIKAT